MSMEVQAKLVSLLRAQAEGLPHFKQPAHAVLLRAGLSNFAYKLTISSKEYVVKFAIAPASKPSVYIQANYEKKIAEKTRGLKISPAYYGFGSVFLAGRKFPFSIQQFIAGREVDYSRDLQPVARTLAILHKKTHGKKKICNYKVLEPSNYLRKNALRHMQRHQGGEMDKLLSGFAEKSLVSLEDAGGADYFSLIHNDLTAENIILSRGKAYLIDWGWAMYSSAAFDLCNFLSPFTTCWTRPQFISEAQVRKFVRAYLKNFTKEQGAVLLGRFSQYWPAYNSLLANWIYYEFLQTHRTRERSHFGRTEFMESALERVKILGASIRKMPLV